MQGCLASLIAFAIIGAIGAVASWLWGMGKRAVKGTSLSKSQEEELKQFKTDHPDGK